MYHHKNVDTFNVKIRVYHNYEQKFIDTPYYLYDKQLKKHPHNKGEFLIKDPFFKKLINTELDQYRLANGNLGSRLKLFSSEALKSFLMKSQQSIDFIKFCEEFIDDLEEKTAQKLKGNLISMLNWLNENYNLSNYIGS